jgi:DNA-binding NarL/FixJ family response regulator
VPLDKRMPRMDGVEAVRQMTAALPRTRVIGLYVHAEQHVVSEMLAAGAWSFVPASSSPKELTAAIRSAMMPGKGNRGAPG